MILVVMDGVRVLLRLLAGPAAFVWLLLQPRGVVVAENLFLRKQLAMYQERGMKPRRPDVADRVSLVVLSRYFDWRDALAVVTPRMLVPWRRVGFRLFPERDTPSNGRLDAATATGGYPDRSWVSIPRSRSG